MLDVHKQTSSGNLRTEPFSRGLWDCPALTSFLSECKGPCIGHSPSCFSLQISHPVNKILLLLSCLSHWVMTFKELRHKDFDVFGSKLANENKGRNLCPTRNTYTTKSRYRDQWIFDKKITVMIVVASFPRHK